MDGQTESGLTDCLLAHRMKYSQGLRSEQITVWCTLPISDRTNSLVAICDVILGDKYNL